MARSDAESPAKESKEALNLEDDKVDEEEEEPMEIASVETVSDAVDKDEPSAKKSKKGEDDDESETTKEKVLKENIQPEKLKVIELRNELKVTIKP